MRLVRSRAVAHVRPFRAVRYDEQRAGPLASLVAPPYDVLDDEARERYLAASPHNVVHLTLADDETEAAALWSAWLAEGILVREDEAARAGGSHRSTSGPTASRERARASSALFGPSRTRPASSCRTSARTRGRRRDAFACCARSRAQVEPIFLLYDGRLERPDGESVLEVELEGVAQQALAPRRATRRTCSPTRSC